ncbi:serine hydrolase [Paenibacillus sp. NPDC058174]|uniref:serine hydrolase n=1 Tax=Paenibacillus sp. NPDC058174 TaxID=3346366 RepID=UPI0036DEA324
MSSPMRKMYAKTILLALLITVLGTSLLGSQTPASAAEQTATTAITSELEGAADINDSTKLAAFIDGIMNVQMENYKIPGAVIAIVKDGKTVLAKGYGHADIEKGTPIDPKTSLFRIASTTKLFTWTAVMQLVEQGKIDLDADINSYLKSMKVPDTYSQPITMRHLMTHTAGFEEGGVGYQITTDPAKLPGSISETLTKHRLARVNPPGEMMSYSNYGTALAGLIVEEVSGMSYNDYIQKNIFDTLDMKYASVQEPVPAALKPHEVIGYARDGGSYITQPPTFEGGFRPAGSGSVSALDMTHFMIAHLQNGRYGDKQILKPETAELMHSPAFVFHKGMPAMDLGFYELKINGLRIISHGGADPLFTTELHLIPEKQFGIFLSYSGGEGSLAAMGLTKALLDRYYPAPEVNLPPASSTTDESLQKYAGSYQFVRRNHTAIDKFYSFLAKMSIGVSGNRLTIGSGAEQQTYAPIGDDLFQSEEGNLIAFRTDESGKVTHLFIDFLSSEPLERAPLINQTKLWFPLLGLSLALFVTVLLSSIYRRRDIKAMPVMQKWAVRLSAITAGWAIATSLGTFVIVLNMGLIDRLSRITSSLNIFLFMPIILVVLTVVLLAFSVLAWKNSYWTLLKRVHYTLIALAAVAMCAFFYYWNLLGWQFG